MANLAEQGDPDDITNEFRRTRRWIFVLLALFIPVFVVGFALNDLFHSELPLTLFVIVFFTSLIYLSVRAFVLHYKLTGKYPFYWLNR